MKKTHWLLMAAFALCCNAVVGQRIEGRVFDKQNNQPLNNAQIDLFSRTGKKIQSVSTDFNGNYYYQGPDAQEIYKVAGSAQGYTTAEVIVNSGANGTLVIFGLVQNVENTPSVKPVNSSVQGLNIASKAMQDTSELIKQKEALEKEIARLNQKHQEDFPHNVAAFQAANAANNAAPMPQGVYTTNAVVNSATNAVVDSSTEPHSSAPVHSVKNPTSDPRGISSENYTTVIQNNNVNKEASPGKNTNYTTIETPQGSYTTNATVNQRSYHSFQPEQMRSVQKDTLAKQSKQDSSSNKANNTNAKVIPATKLLPATKQKDNNISYGGNSEAKDFIFFDFNSSYFNPSHDRELMQIVNHLLENDHHKIHVTVYVDKNSENFEYQHWLNQRRGQRIYDYLVANGINRNRINVKTHDLSMNPPTNTSKQRMLRQCGIEITV